MANSNRVPLIDWLRGLAALCVVIFHFNELRPSTDWYQTAASFGWLGVPVFFVVSGYCIFLAALREPNWAPFLVARIFRIWPAYVLSLFLICVLVGVRTVTTGTNDITVVPKTIEGILATLFLAYSPLTDVKGMNWVYWTLTYEFTFYLVVTLGLILRKFSPILIVLLTVMSCFETLHDQKLLFFLRHWGLFASGIALVLMVRKQYLYASILLAISLVSIWINEPKSSSIVAYITCILIIAASQDAFQKLNLQMPFLDHLGNWSYSLYLLHIPVGIYLFGRFANYEQMRSISNVMVTDFVLLGICLIYAAMAYYLVELPGIRLGKYLAKRVSNGEKKMPMGQYAEA